MMRTLDAYLDHIGACNRWSAKEYVPFRIDHQRYGAVRRDRLDRLAVEDDLLTVTQDWVELIAKPDRLSRSAALADLVQRLVASGDLPKVRRELYPVLRRWGQEPVALLDRGAADYFGIRAYGVHLNVLSEDEMWIARRARDKAVAPGKLDNLVAGGQPYGLSPLENLIKECAEEASMPADLAGQATIDKVQLTAKLLAKGYAKLDKLEATLAELGDTRKAAQQRVTDVMAAGGEGFDEASRAFKQANNKFDRALDARMSQINDTRAGIKALRGLLDELDDELALLLEV